MSDQRHCTSLRFDPETNRATEVPTDDALLRHADLMRDRYLGIAKLLISEAAERVHVALDTSMGGGDGHAPRRVVLAAEAPELARVISDSELVQVGRYDAVVIMGPTFVGWDESDERLREVVASDMGSIVGSLYPIKSEGGIQSIMPYVVQIAASLTCYGAASPETSEQRAERAAARALKAAAHDSYSSWNAQGQFLTDNPAWPYLAEAVAREARRGGATIQAAISFEAMARMVHEAVGRALGVLGVRIVANAAP